jgi:hypothetical protein
MKANYTVVNGLTCDGQTMFVVSNYTGTNLVTTRGFFKLPLLNNNDIGIWKIKQSKNEKNDR